MFPAVERVSAWRACRRKGIREQLKALYSLMGGRRYPRGPQEQLGADAVHKLLLGGSGFALAASPPLVLPPPAAQQSACLFELLSVAGGVGPGVCAAAASSVPAVAFVQVDAPQVFSF